MSYACVCVLACVHVCVHVHVCVRVLACVHVCVHVLDGEGSRVVASTALVVV